MPEITEFDLVVLANQRQPSESIRQIYASECRRCGVCCVLFMQEPFNIRCSSDREIPKQYKQIGPRHGWGNEYLRVVKLTRDKPFTGAAQMRKCMALSGPVRENVSCTIYEQRPHACINYAPGSPSCVLARKWASLEDPEDLYHLGRS